MGPAQLTELTKWRKCFVVWVFGQFPAVGWSVGESLWLPFEGAKVLAVGLVDTSLVI